MQTGGQQPVLRFQVEEMPQLVTAAHVTLVTGEQPPRGCRETRLRADRTVCLPKPFDEDRLLTAISDALT